MQQCQSRLMPAARWLKVDHTTSAGVWPSWKEPLGQAVDCRPASFVATEHRHCLFAIVSRHSCPHLRPRQGLSQRVLKRSRIAASFGARAGYRNPVLSAPCYNTLSIISDAKLTNVVDDVRGCEKNLSQIFRCTFRARHASRGNQKRMPRLLQAQAICGLSDSKMLS